MNVQAFRKLSIGKTFDFVSGDWRMDSFVKPCRKVSNTMYEDCDGMVHRVGSLNALIYHVGKFCPVCFGEHPTGCCAKDGHGG